jgi:hypothetical protein
MKKTKTLLLILCLVALSSADPFERVFQFILAHELATYCHDGGFPSKYGISKQWYPNEDIKHMTEARAREIYRRDYWQRIGADMMGDTMLAFVDMICAVHCGQPTAIMMQKDCWDAQGLYEKYRHKIARLIIDNPEQYIRFLEAWMQQVTDLGIAINK